MKSTKTLIYTLFACILVIGIVISWYFYFENPPQREVPILTFQKPSKTLFEQNQLLSFAPIKQISIGRNVLIIGADSLAFKTDTIESNIVCLPNKPNVWKNYWSAILGESFKNDGSRRWELTLLKVKTPLFEEWEMLSKQKGFEKLNEEEQLVNVLVNTLETNPNLSFYIQDKLLQKSAKVNVKSLNSTGLVVSNQNSENIENIPSLIKWFLPVALILFGVLGLFFTKKIDFTNIQVGEIITDKVIEEESFEVSLADMVLPKKIISDEGVLIKSEDHVRNYFENFQKIYGDFYTNLELLPEYPNDELTKQKIKQQLIEMGLHAHSFTRAYLLNYLSRPQKEPNILLIQEQKKVKDLTSDLYKILTLDGQKTSKRYRFLAKIIKEMNIDSLEGALLNDTYIPKEILTKPE